MDYIQESLNSMDFLVPAKKSEYYNDDHIKVPRVTEILSRMIHNDGLMYWANSLGFKGLRYRDELNRAADIGSIAHSCIEKFLKDKFETESNIPFLGFLSWYNIVTQDAGLPVEVIYSEHKIVCKWFGGTLDALMNIGGRVFLVDFKTSNHVTFNYFLQLAAYGYMLKEVENIDIDGVIVLQLNKNEPGFNEYLLDFSIPDHLTFMNNCTTAFLSLVYAFFNISRVEMEFKNVFNKKEEGVLCKT